MLLIGDHNTIPYGMIDDLVVYNLFSLKEGLDNLNLIPSIRMDYNSKEFDRLYAQNIISNDDTFIELMRIVYPLYEGKNVYLVTVLNDSFDGLTESILKLIQDRYGYNYSIINSYEDLQYLDDSSDFSLSGLFNLDHDKERMSYILMQQQQ